MNEDKILPIGLYKCPKCKREQVSFGRIAYKCHYCGFKIIEMIKRFYFKETEFIDLIKTE